MKIKGQGLQPLATGCSCHFDAKRCPIHLSTTVKKVPGNPIPTSLMRLEQDALDVVVDALPNLLTPYQWGSIADDRYEVVAAIVHAYLDAMFGFDEHEIVFRMGARQRAGTGDSDA